VTALLLISALVAQADINIQLDDSKDRIPAIRRTNPRDEPVLVKIVEERGPGSMSALFSLGYLRDPAPRTLEVLRDAAVAPEILVSYPAICSLWRIDDPAWRTLATAALPRLARSQQLHLAGLLFRAGDFSAWRLLREPVLDMLAVPGSEEKLKFDAYSLIAGAWMMKEEPGEPMRDLRKLLSKRESAQERDRTGKLLDEFDFQKHSLRGDASHIQ